MKNLEIKLKLFNGLKNPVFYPIFTPNITFLFFRQFTIMSKMSSINDIDVMNMIDNEPPYDDDVEEKKTSPVPPETQESKVNENFTEETKSVKAKSFSESPPGLGESDDEQGVAQNDQHVPEYKQKIYTNESKSSIGSSLSDDVSEEKEPVMKESNILLFKDEDNSYKIYPVGQSFFYENFNYEFNIPENFDLQTGDFAVIEDDEGTIVFMGKSGDKLLWLSLDPWKEYKFNYIFEVDDINYIDEDDNSLNLGRTIKPLEIQSHFGKSGKKYTSASGEILQCGDIIRWTYKNKIFHAVWIGSDDRLYIGIGYNSTRNVFSKKKLILRDVEIIYRREKRTPTRIVRHTITDIINKKQYSDVRLNLIDDGNQIVYAYRGMLVLKSKFFKHLFKFSNKQGVRQKMFELSKITKQELLYILEYIYTGQIDVTETNVSSLLEYSEFFQIPDLVSFLKELDLKEYVGNTNVDNFTDFAIRTKNKELLRECVFKGIWLGFAKSDPSIIDKYMKLCSENNFDVPIFDNDIWKKDAEKAADKNANVVDRIRLDNMTASVYLDFAIKNNLDKFAGKIYLFAKQHGNKNTRKDIKNILRKLDFDRYDAITDSAITFASQSNM
jgi:hypothetical protein